MSLLEPGGPRLSAKDFSHRLAWLLERFGEVHQDYEERTGEEWLRKMEGWFDGDIDDDSMADRGYKCERRDGT